MEQACPPQEIPGEIPASSLPAEIDRLLVNVICRTGRYVHKPN